MDELLIEIYIDHYLDLVDFESITVSEGVMETPFEVLKKTLPKKILSKDKEIRALSKKISSAQRRAGVERWVGKEPPLWRKALIGRKFALFKGETRKQAREAAKGRQKWIEKALKRKNELAKELKSMNSLMAKVKSGEGLLGNIPYLYLYIGAGIIFSTVAYFSYKIYKRYFSKAAKVCEGRKGDVMTACMLRYKIMALEKSKYPLEKAIGGCSNAEEPGPCRERINKRLNSIEKKIEKNKTKLKNLEGKK